MARENHFSFAFYYLHQLIFTDTLSYNKYVYLYILDRKA